MGRNRNLNLNAFRTGRGGCEGILLYCFQIKYCIKQLLPPRILLMTRWKHLLTALYTVLTLHLVSAELRSGQTVVLPFV